MQFYRQGPKPSWVHLRIATIPTFALPHFAENCTNLTETNRVREHRPPPPPQCHPIDVPLLTYHPSQTITLTEVPCTSHALMCPLLTCTNIPPSPTCPHWYMPPITDAFLQQQDSASLWLNNWQESAYNFFIRKLWLNFFSEISSRIIALTSFLFVVNFYLTVKLQMLDWTTLTNVTVQDKHVLTGKQIYWKLTISPSPFAQRYLHKPFNQGRRASNADSSPSCTLDVNRQFPFDPNMIFCCWNNGHSQWRLLFSWWRLAFKLLHYGF